MAAFIKQSSPLGHLTSRYWSPSALWTIDRVVVLTGLGFATAAVNAAIRNVAVIRACQALAAPAHPGSGRAVVPVPAVGILRPPAYTLMGVLPFMALGWLCVGAIAAGFLRTRRRRLQDAGRVFMPADR